MDTIERLVKYDTRDAPRSISPFAFSSDTQSTVSKCNEKMCRVGTLCDQHRAAVAAPQDLHRRVQRRRAQGSAAEVLERRPALDSTRSQRVHCVHQARRPRLRRAVQPAKSALGQQHLFATAERVPLLKGDRARRGLALVVGVVVATLARVPVVVDQRPRLRPVRRLGVVVGGVVVARDARLTSRRRRTRIRLFVLTS